MPWAQISLVVPAFAGSGGADLSVPCSFDFSLATTRYFAALEGGDLPLGFLFSGTVFHETEEGSLQAAPIPWNKEASFRLPVETWRSLMNRYYPGTTWHRLSRDRYRRLEDYRLRRGLPSVEAALDRLLSHAEDAADLANEKAGAS
jgi:hypothetical protein